LSALFCYNDLVALGALRGCRNLGLRIPADVAIAGFDDIMLAAVVTPALTTCHVPREELGKMAATLLLDCIKNGVTDGQELVIDPELTVRDSTRRL
jgi:LacI family transcriptional regulator